MSTAPDADKENDVTLEQYRMADIGVYRRDGDVYRVVTSKGSGRNYAMRLVITNTRSGDPRGSWQYAPVVVYELTPEQRLTVEDAVQAGRMTGVCVICGATLADPESIERGMGPVCATLIRLGLI